MSKIEKDSSNVSDLRISNTYWNGTLVDVYRSLVVVGIIIAGAMFFLKEDVTWTEIILALFISLIGLVSWIGLVRLYTNALKLKRAESRDEYRRGYEIGYNDHTNGYPADWQRFAGKP